MDGAVHEFIAEETKFKVSSVASPAQSVFITPPGQYLAPLLVVPALHLIQVIGKPKPQVALDQCSFCRQKGHWKNACPKLLQPKGRNTFAPSISQPSQQTPRPLTAFATPTASGVPPSPLFDRYQKFQAFLATQGNH